MAVGLAAACWVFYLNAQGTDNLFARLCDGCFVAAVLLIGFGGLVFSRNHGAFDMITFGVQTVFQIHMPWTSIGGALDKKETYAEYRERKAKERKPANECLLAGCIYLTLAVLFLILYYCLT